MIWYYKLVGKIAVPYDVMSWGEWFETADRHVAVTEVGPITVSTVFVGINLRVGGVGDPLIFETMIFGENESSEWSASYTDRTSTWAQAETAHARAVAHAEGQLARIGVVWTPPTVT